MEKRYYSEYSQCLDRNMDFIVYGHSGVPLLVFPAQDGHPQDYENFGMVDVIKDKIENGLNLLLYPKEIGIPCSYAHNVSITFFFFFTAR